MNVKAVSSTSKQGGPEPVQDVYYTSGVALPTARTRRGHRLVRQRARFRTVGRTDTFLAARVLVGRCLADVNFQESHVGWKWRHRNSPSLGRAALIDGRVKRLVQMRHAPPSSISHPTGPLDWRAGPVQGSTALSGTLGQPGFLARAIPRRARLAHCHGCGQGWRLRQQICKANLVGVWVVRVRLGACVD